MAENKRIIRIEDKVDHIKDSISAINVTLASQHESLKEHMRRTSAIEEEFKPIRKHVSMVQGIMKFGAALAVLCGAIEGIVVLLEYLQK